MNPRKNEESKARKAAEAAVKVATGNDGQLGRAKKEISTRRSRLEEEERKALGLKNGGMVGRKKR